MRASTPTRRAGPWMLSDLLGEGGAGSVWAAKNRFGEEAAVKLMHDSLVGDERAKERFNREANLAGSVVHPGLAKVLDRGTTDDGVPYIALELLHGETIEARRVRKGGRLSVREVVWIADRTLAALSALHAKGIVHRDVKPENLFLTARGELKLLDLGIARVQNRALTNAGALLGTIAFMAPEQARGEVAEIDVQTDLWCVGATMYMLLSGQFIRDAANVRAMLMSAAHSEVPSIGKVVAGLPAELVDMVDFVLSLDKGRRWPSAAAMRRALRMVYARLVKPSRQEEDEDDDDADSLNPSVVQEIPPPNPNARRGPVHSEAPPPDVQEVPQPAALADTVAEEEDPVRSSALNFAPPSGPPPRESSHRLLPQRGVDELAEAPRPAAKTTRRERALWIAVVVLAALLVTVVVLLVARA